MENLKINQQVITDEDIKKVSWRWIMASQITWNYEKMMAPGYFYAMLPVLRKLYTKEDELKDMMHNHLQFFNTTPHMGGFILGIDMATEESEGIKGKEAVNGIKTGLMGPFAGVGDTIVGVLIGTIFGSIAAYMGVNGNPTGVVLWMVVQALLMVGRYFTVGMSYKQGMKMVTSTRDRLNAITQAATLLGITVVGALIASVIRVNVAASFVSGEVTVAGQDVLDQIMPKLLPVLLVAGVYTLLGKKNMTSTKAILIVMVVSIILYAIGFLA
ncbi:MAG: PTS system mannose/fructose/sorbose family transporter subunit IID [Lachnospiraceae bacterium]|jgi:PTS system mannose-specific IID component|nr:PTS system mannose/fructose/sorbose family transporter subunit IID [Lachnospiraceae bacterium]